MATITEEEQQIMGRDARGADKGLARYGVDIRFVLTSPFNF